VVCALKELDYPRKSHRVLRMGQPDVLLVPMEITWETLGDNTTIDDHISPFTNKKMGKRIFPDKKTVDDATARDKVQVRVKTSPGCAGWTVYVKAFDVDDATPFTFDQDNNGNPVIDTNDTGAGLRPGNDNFQEVGVFTETSQITASKQLDANGEAVFEFQVGMQPGNNYRVAASLINEDGLTGLQVDDAQQPKYVGPDEKTESPGNLSPMLTVWRRLWLEFDSMGPPGANGGEANSETGTIDNYTDNGNGTATLNLSISLEDEANRCENGLLSIAGVGNFKVISNTDNWLTDDDVVIQGTPGATVVGKSFEIWDDDVVALSETTRQPRNLPYQLSPGNLLKAYNDAYISPLMVPEEYVDNDVPFNRNLTNSVEWFSIVSAYRDVEPAPDRWTAYLLAAWQDDTDVDSDPSVGNNQSINGMAADIINVGAIYVETIREEEGIPSTPRITEEHTIVHEIGHQGGGDHSDGGIMDHGAPIGENKFKPITIKRFREEQDF